MCFWICASCLPLAGDSRVRRTCGRATKRYAKEYYMDMTRSCFAGWCRARPGILGMTREFEWSVYEAATAPNKEQLLPSATGRSPFARALELQHPMFFLHVAFNTAAKTKLNRPCFTCDGLLGWQTVRHPGRSLSDLAVRNESIEEDV